MSAKRHPAPHNTEAKPVKSILFLLVLTFAAAPALAGQAKAFAKLGIKGFERTTFWHVHPGLTDKDIANSVDAFVRSGVSGVIVGGGRHHYLHDDLPFLDEQIDVTARVVKACHAKGIRVCEHHSVVLTTRKDYAREHQDWIQRDFYTGGFSVWPEYQTYAFCPNNKAFREHYWTLLADIVQRTGVDAVMSDDASFHHGCACKTCSDLWANEVGGSLVEARKASKKTGTAEWRQWNAVRQRWYTDFRVWLYGKMRREMPKVQCFSLLGALLSPWGPQTSGANQEGMLDTGDASWWEVYNPADFASWRPLAVEATALYETGRVRKSDIVSLPYADRAEARDKVDPEEETFMWALSMAHGIAFTQARVFLTGITPDEPARDYWVFERDVLQPYRDAEPAASIGIFFSRRSRDADPKWQDSHSGPAIGWGESLQDAGIPYRAVVEETLDSGLPKDIRTLILPNVFAISDAHLDKLERFVRGGGTLIATHQTGYTDENGEPLHDRHKKRLEKALGFRIRVDSKSGLSAESNTPLLRRVLAGSLTVYEVALDRGKVVYLPDLDERKAFQNLMNEGDPYRDPRDPEVVRSLAELALSASPAPPVLVESKPTVLTTAWKMKDRLLVHMVNTAGAVWKDGEKIPAPSKVTWSDTQDLKVSLDKPAQRARILSLDAGENTVIESPGREFRVKSPRRYALMVVEY